MSEEVKKEAEQSAASPSMFGAFFNAARSAVSTTTSLVSKALEHEPKKEIDVEAEIGRFVMSELGGTRLSGRITTEYNMSLPENIIEGSVTVSLHESGVHLNQKPGLPYLIRRDTIENISVKKHLTTQRVGVASSLVSNAVDGAIAGGLLGAGLSVGKAMLTGESGEIKDVLIAYIQFEFMDNGKKKTLLIESEPEIADKFSSRSTERFANINRDASEFIREV